jgi:hypothetical protein
LSKRLLHLYNADKLIVDKCAKYAKQQRPSAPGDSRATGPLEPPSHEDDAVALAPPVPRPCARPSPADARRPAQYLPPPVKRLKAEPPATPSSGSRAAGPSRPQPEPEPEPQDESSVLDLFESQHFRFSTGRSAAPRTVYAPPALPPAPLPAPQPPMAFSSEVAHGGTDPRSPESGREPLREIQDGGTSTHVGLKKPVNAAPAAPWPPPPPPAMAKDPGVGYRYTEVVREKEKRRMMPGFACEQCQAFCDAVGGGGVDGNQLLQACSRHRHKWAPPSTPEGFWNLSFADSHPSQRMPGHP